MTCTRGPTTLGDPCIQITVSVGIEQGGVRGCMVNSVITEQLPRVGERRISIVSPDGMLTTISSEQDIYIVIRIDIADGNIPDPKDVQCHHR